MSRSTVSRRFATFAAWATTVLCVVFAASSVSAQVQKTSKSRKAHLPSLTTDQPDYGPGEIAVLTGFGFVPTEFVSVRVVHADGTPSTGEDHEPWTVAADESGRFLTTWHVCEDDCVNKPLLATADGMSSGLHASVSFTDSHTCGTGIVTSVTGVGGSCSAFTPAVGSGPDNYEVAQGGTYTMTIEGVTECTGNTITVFIQSSGTGNFCFNATGGSGTYAGTFTMPNPACNTMPVSYKCGASATCNHPNSFAASGPNSLCGGVHLRASNFNGSCVKTGDDTTCTNTTPTGSCCLADGSCVQVSASDCSAQGGTYGGDGSLCANVSCLQPDGACCLVDGSCQEVTEEECTVLGGTFNGDGSLCVNANCPPASGACCLANGSCVQISEADCTAQGGTYSGDFSLCVDVTCQQPDGACCLVDGTCFEITEEECTEQGGTFHGDFSLCDDVTCPPAAGACCLADGSCVQVSEADCTAQGGTFQGDFTLCVDVTCQPPLGACCTDANTCVQVTEEECTEQGGVYHGDFSLCSNVSCPDDFPPGCVTYTLDFSADDQGNPMPHGAKVDTEFDGGPVFPVTITSSVNLSGAATAAILDSTTGPAAVDPDLLVGKGNILILQNDSNLSECPPASGVYCSHNDDEDGGLLTFTYNVPVSPTSIVLIDIDEGDRTSTVVLTDSNGKTRTYTVPSYWTGDQIEDGPPGWGTLSLTTLANQPGLNSTVTATEQAGFNPASVIIIDVTLNGSAGVDDLIWCQ